MVKRYIGVDPGSKEGDFATTIIAGINRFTGVITVMDEQVTRTAKEILKMGEQMFAIRKWQDENGNVYGIEKTSRHGHFVVIRVNPGGNRKRAKQVTAIGSPAFVQKALDQAAQENKWMEVAE